MTELNKDKIHIKCNKNVDEEKSFLPRKYTLTHSDSTGDLFLTIDCDYDSEEMNRLYSKFMRDEVIGEWIEKKGKYELHIYLHISGGLIFGWTSLRDKIFRYHLPEVLKVIRYGDNHLFQCFPHLDESLIIVHFQSKRKKYNKIENYGFLKDFKS
jgi:hypothetical protein